MLTNLGIVAFLIFGVSFAIYNVRRHRKGLVAERGLSIGADLGSLADKPRVRVRSVTKYGPERVRILLAPETHRDDGPVLEQSGDLDIVVSMNDDDFGFKLLQDWERDESLVAIVMPPGSRLVRLRSIDNLQPLTLSLVDTF